jgi:hypothetical protein
VHLSRSQPLLLIVVSRQLFAAMMGMKGDVARRPSGIRWGGTVWLPHARATIGCRGRAGHAPWIHPLRWVAATEPSPELLT